VYENDEARARDEIGAVSARNNVGASNPVSTIKRDLRRRTFHRQVNSSSSSTTTRESAAFITYSLVGCPYALS